MNGKIAAAFMGGLIIGAGLVWGSGIFSNGRYVLSMTGDALVDTRTSSIYGVRREVNETTGGKSFKFYIEPRVTTIPVRDRLWGHRR